MKSLDNNGGGNRPTRLNYGKSAGTSSDNTKNRKKRYRRTRYTYKPSVTFRSYTEEKIFKTENLDDDYIKGPEYMQLTPAFLPKNLPTVKIIGLPKKLSEKGLYNFAKCFGHVVNIYILPDDAIKGNDKDNDLTAVVNNGITSEPPSSATDHDVVKGKDADVNKIGCQGNVPAETYSAMITFNRPGSANQLKRLDGTVTFGNQITVEFERWQSNNGDKKLQQKSVPKKHNSNKVVTRKNVNVSRMPNEILRKIFSFLDFRTRIRVESVCRRWRLLLLRDGEKLTPAEGKPKNMTFVINILNNPSEFKDTQVKFDKTENRIEMSFVNKRRKGELRSLLTKILPKFAGDVIDVSFAGDLEIDKSILALLLKYCSEKCNYSFDGVFLYNIPFAFVQAFVRRCGSKLKVIPEFPLDH